MNPLGSSDSTRQERDHFHQVCLRLAENYNVNDLWLARRKVQQAVRKVYDSYRTVKSVVATRKGIEGIERHREIL